MENERGWKILNVNTNLFYSQGRWSKNGKIYFKKGHLTSALQSIEHDLKRQRDPRRIMEEMIMIVEVETRVLDNISMARYLDSQKESKLNRQLKKERAYRKRMLEYNRTKLEEQLKSQGSIEEQIKKIDQELNEL